MLSLSPVVPYSPKDALGEKSAVLEGQPFQGCHCGFLVSHIIAWGGLSHAVVTLQALSGNGPPSAAP